MEEEGSSVAIAALIVGWKVFITIYLWVSLVGIIIAEAHGHRHLYRSLSIHQLHHPHIASQEHGGHDKSNDQPIWHKASTSDRVDMWKPDTGKATTTYFFPQKALQKEAWCTQDPTTTMHLLFSLCFSFGTGVRDGTWYCGMGSDVCG